jgi:hypothetical protein
LECLGESEYRRTKQKIQTKAIREIKQKSKKKKKKEENPLFSIRYLPD